jgi:hypothetical protein
MGMDTIMNRRKDDRYPIQEIPVGGLGTIIEVSRRGLKIKKEAQNNPKTASLSFTVATLEIKTQVKWDDGTFLGVELTSPLSDPTFFIKKTKKSKENIAPPQMKVLPDKVIQHYKNEEMLTSMINLLMEVEGIEPDVRKIGSYIDLICRQEEKEAKPEGDKQELLELGDEPITYKDELIFLARELKSRDKTEVKDINFAITILGVDMVREHILNHIRKRMFQFGISLSGFENYEKFIVLKSVFFKDLCRFFGFLDIHPEGSSLLSSETIGFEMLIKESSGILDQYYKTPTRLYSEVSRTYEKAFFGTDPLQVNKMYFDTFLKTFGDLYNGYILAHCTLNPHFSPSEELKISISKNGLIFSFMTYLTFLALKFLLDKDRGSGYVLAMKLKGKGMDWSKVNEFIGQTIQDTETILKDLALPGKVSHPSLPDGSLNIERYLGKDVRFVYLRRAFENLGRGKVKRLALRYEDDAYTHFILGQMINAESLYLSSKTGCVIPCKNVSEDPWYVQDFNYFNLLVFKDIPKLSPSHLDVFLKLWETFEGQIIATFSYLNFLDFTKAPLYKILKDHIVDFPSGLVNEGIYGKMVDHTVEYLSPYLPEKQVEGKQFLNELSAMNQKVDRKRFLSEVFTMNHIKADILLTEEIS